MNILVGLDASHLQIDLKKLALNLKTAKNLEHQWVPETQRVIPLFSLSEVAPGQLEKLTHFLHSVSQRSAPLELKLDGVWAYPNQDEARLLWIGVQNSVALKALHGDILQVLLAENLVATEKDFKPILPIVRLRNHREVSDLLSPHKNASFGKLKVADLCVLEMTSGGPFPTFLEISRHPLQD